MLKSTELIEDLWYLQERYEISSTMIDGLTVSPTSAQKNIRQYKTQILGICLLFISMGGTFIVIALLRHSQWIGFLSGVIGSVIIIYALSVYKKMKSTIFVIEKVAKYHGLL